MTEKQSITFPSQSLETLAGIFTESHEHIKKDPSLSDLITLACAQVAKSLNLSFKPPQEGGYETNVNKLFQNITCTSQLLVKNICIDPESIQKDLGYIIGILRNDVYLLMFNKKGFYEAINIRTQSVTRASKLETHFYREASFYLISGALPEHKLKGQDILKFVYHHAKTDLKQILTSQILLGLVTLLLPMTMGFIFSTVLPASSYTLLLHCISGLFVITLAATLVKISQIIAIMRLKFKSNAALQVAIWDRLLRLPSKFFQHYSVGDLSTRASAVDKIQQKVSGLVLVSLMGGVSAMFALLLILVISPIMGLLVFVVSLLQGIIGFFVFRFLLKHVSKFYHLHGKNIGLSYQLVSNIANIRVSACGSALFNYWLKLFSKKQRSYVKMQYAYITLNIIPNFLALLAMIAFFSYAVSHRNTFSFNAFIIVNAAFAQYFTAISTLILTLVGIVDVIPLYSRMRPILETSPDPKPLPTSSPIVKGAINLENITFHYQEAASPIFNNLCLKVPSGKCTAIVGVSGAGKSTLFRLLLGFETPEAGKITFDETALTPLSAPHLRSQMGVIMQDATLLPGTILDNIIGLDPKLNEKDAWEALTIVCLKEEIEALPMGLLTPVPEGGRTFSQGQCQRLMLARALVRKPKILLLDEAMNAIDTLTARKINAHIENLKITQLIISHSIKTLLTADQIHVLENGIFVQSGNYSELLNKEGAFKRMLHQ